MGDGGGWRMSSFSNDSYMKVLERQMSKVGSTNKGSVPSNISSLEDWLTKEKMGKVEKSVASVGSPSRSKSTTAAHNPLAASPPPPEAHHTAAPSKPRQAVQAPSNLHSDSDFVELTDSYTITTDVPGMTPESLDLELQNGTLKVSGQRKAAPIPDQAGMHVHRSERSFSRFQRSFQLPQDAVVEGIRATLKNGVLTITVPKQVQKAESKRIKILTS